MVYSERTRKKYLPKFKKPANCKLIFDTEVKEKLVKTLFYHLRNNGGSIPTEFNLFLYRYFIRFSFKQCKSEIKKETGTLIVKPIYDGKILSEEDIEDLVLDLVEDLRTK